MKKEFSELRKNLKKDNSTLKSIKVAILGDTSTQFLTQAIKGLGYDYGFNLLMIEADFNQIERQVFDSNSELYTFSPEIIIIFKSSHKLLQSYNKTNSDREFIASKEIELVNQLYLSITSQLNSKIIFYNYTEIDDSVFGSFANKIESSFLFQLRKLNMDLMYFAAKHNNFLICDISSVQNLIGKNAFFQTSVYINTEMVLSIDSLPLIAAKTLDIINVLNGKIKKCVVLDLDNTTWGGIIGDDGIENIQIGSLGIGKAFTEFQYWIKKLKERGIIIAVCSKNTESVAKEPFEKHPDMVLRLDDIAIFTANWGNKVDNIRSIKELLNIGFDSMVFLDDNPFERNIVRENIPEILVPELPEDPAEYLEFLYSLNIFETTAVSSEDKERTKLYQIEAQRNVIQKQFANEDDFLKSLEMKSIVEPFNKFNIPRVSQLSQRSNQFNLRTIRYSESEIEKISTSNLYRTFSFSLEDKFGDNGLICVIILKCISPTELFIDTWFMSCRVLKRGMEGFVLNTIVDFGLKNGIKQIIGEYLPSPKNDMVKDHYQNLGFIKDSNQWKLALEEYKPFNNYITIKNK